MDTNEIQKYIFHYKQKLEERKYRLNCERTENLDDDEVVEINALADLKNNVVTEYKVYSPKPKGNNYSNKHDDCNNLCQSSSSMYFWQNCDPKKIDNCNDNFSSPKHSGNENNMCLGEYNYSTMEISENEKAYSKKVCFEFTSQKKCRKHLKSQDQMEQWVTDAFYSYFPSLNEGQKRQHSLQDHQLGHNHNLKSIGENNNNTAEVKFGEDIAKMKQIPKNDKTDLEIIVNNPSYDIGKNKDKNYRLESTRHKLLQDLQHTDLSNIVNSNAVQERNKQSIELQLQKKKEYQHDLLRQIEDKRREIKILKEREKLEEEVLAKKIEEQIKTMQIKEELEKQKLQIEMDQKKEEQNRFLLSHVESKLESNHNRGNVSINESNDIKSTENKVYKYFSNSARHYDYRKFHPENCLESIETNMKEGNITIHSDKQNNRTQNYCTHINKNVCPFCDIKLKSYESWCRKCESLVLDDGAENRSLLCENCEDQFLICAACEKRSTPCKFCRQKRNICLHCISNFCIHCGKVVRQIDNGRLPTNVKKSGSERSFQVLKVGYGDHNNFNTYSQVKLEGERIRQPHIMENIDKNSNYYLNKNNIKFPVDKNVDREDFLPASRFWDGTDADEIKIETDNRLAKYLENYGDLVLRNIKTKSTASVDNSPKRENISSMPLLREKPKMKEKIKSKQNSPQSKISALSKKWEVPAVQRITISRSSPSVLTQVGAFRKQLQANEFELDG